MLHTWQLFEEVDGGISESAYNIDGATIRAKYGGLYEWLDMIGPRKIVMSSFMFCSPTNLDPTFSTTLEGTSNPSRENPPEMR